MSGRTTIFLLLAVLAVGGYILFMDHYRPTTEERRAAARQAFRLEPDLVTELRIETPAGLFVLAQSNRQWRLLHPVSVPADQHAVDRILDTMAGLRWRQLITEAEQRNLPAHQDLYGFNPPRVTLTVVENEQTFAIYIGRDAPSGQELYMRRSDRGDIIVAPRDLLLALPATALDLRDRRLITMPPARIRRVEWQSGDKLFQASRLADDQWQMERPAHARASGSALRHWLNRLYEFRVHDFIAESMAAASLYGFDEPTVQLTLIGETGAAPHVLKIGHPADAARTTYYATIQGQDSVFSVQEDVVAWLTPEPRDFRDYRLSSLLAPEIHSVHMTEGERSLVLQRGTQDLWEVTAPRRFTAHPAAVQQLLAAWSEALVEDFIDPPIDDWDAYGLGQTNRWIRMTRAPSGTAGAPAQPADRELFLFAGATNASGSFFAAPAGRHFVMLLPGHLGKTFTIDPLTFRDPVVLSLAPGDVQRITQQIDGAEWRVEQTNGLFRTGNPQHVPDTDAIAGIIDLSRGLVAARFIEEDPRDLSRYGLDAPRNQVVFGLAAGGVNRVLWIGNASGPGERFAMRQGIDVVFTLSAESIGILLRPVANWLAPPGISSGVPGME